MACYGQKGNFADGHSPGMAEGLLQSDFILIALDVVFQSPVAATGKKKTKNKKQNRKTGKKPD